MAYRDETETLRAQLEESQRKVAWLESMNGRLLRLESMRRELAAIREPVATPTREVIVWRENGSAALWASNAVTTSFGAAVLLGLAGGAALANGLVWLGAAVGALALASLACGLYIWWRSLPREHRPA